MGAIRHLEVFTEGSSVVNALSSWLEVEITCDELSTSDVLKMVGSLHTHWSAPKSKTGTKVTHAGIQLSSSTTDFQV